MNILDIFFPKQCLACGRFGKYFCNRCTGTIRIIGVSEAICPICEHPAIGGMTHPRCQTKYSLDGLTSIFHYDGIIQRAIKALKYRRVTDLAQEFVDLVPRSCHPSVSRDPVFIPIPLHPSRFRDRGFNQAEVLGRPLAGRLHIPIRNDILRRVKATTPQVEMKDRGKRINNMNKVFAVNNSTIQQCNTVTVCLFDDVFTTGATMRAAGETLKRAGATFVWAVTMAR